jgi:hypothetical protein
MMERGEIDFNYWGAADDAYAGGDQMITPYPGAHDHRSPCDNFNYYQSSTRIRIECAFGRLVQRFGILWRPLRCKFNFIAPVVFACMILHNLCFDDREFDHDSIDHVSPFTVRGTHHRAANRSDCGNAEPDVFEQNDCYNTTDEGNKSARAHVRAMNRSAITRRDVLCDKLKKNHPGMRRPDRNRRDTVNSDNNGL